MVITRDSVRSGCENHIAPDNRFLNKSTKVYYAILLKVHETNLNNTKQNTYIHVLGNERLRFGDR